MKKLIIILFSIISIVSMAQEKVTWDYPVKPGSKEWKSQIKNNEDCIRVCQIPSESLKNIPTEELASIILDYPLFRDIFAFSPIQNGFNILKERFNGFNELFIRKNAAKELILIYKNQSPERIDPEWDDIKKGDWRFYIFTTEFLLSQNEILSQLSERELEALLEESMTKYNKKINADYSFFVAHSSLLLAGRIINLLNHPDFTSSKKLNPNIDIFLKTGRLEDKETVFIIQQLASNYQK